MQPAFYAEAETAEAMEKVKNYLIFILLLSVIGSFFYGKNIGESKLPDLSSESFSESNTSADIKAESEHSYEKKSREKITYPDGTTVEKEAEEKGNIKEKLDILFGEQKRHYESLILSLKQPEFGFSIGVGYNVDDKEYYFNAGALKAISEKTYIHAEIQGRKKIESGSIKYIKLF